MRLVTDIISYCSRELPQWNPISISGYHIREAGSTAVQEVAFTFGNAIAYVQAVLKAGLKVDDFGPRLSFFFNVHNEWLEEVAKFRAARRLWAKIMRGRFGAKNPRSWMLRFHAQTGGSTLTARQPEVNTVRVALQALAAVLGGTQSLHTNSRDEALSLPTEEAASLALRTQQVIAFESGVAEVADPLGGAYAVESLTDEIEEKSQALLDQIESMGGMLAAIGSGFVQKEIQQSAYEYQKSIESRERIVVGLNEFIAEREEPIAVHRIDPAIELAQVAFLERVQLERSPVAVKESLDEVQETAASRANLVPAISRAVEAYATVGEITERLRRVFGEYQESQS
jgi:methylmalonyl-CoA mutase, N-terminal domain